MNRAFCLALCVACHGQQTQAVEIAPLPSATVTASAPIMQTPKAPVTVIDGVHPVSLAVDATNVYWVDEDHSIRKANVHGGKAEPIAAGDNPSDIAVGPTDVYWVDDPGKSYVRAAPIAGGQRRDVANGGHLKVWSVVTDESHLYWADYFAIHMTTFAPFDRPQELACAQGMMHIAVGPTHVVCDGVLSKTLAVAPLSGSAARVLAPLDAQVSFAIDGSDAYWTNTARPTEVAYAPLDGGTARSFSANATLQRPIAIADGRRLVVARDDGAILSFAREGGASTVLAPPRTPTKVVAIVAKAGAVYVAFADAIIRIPR